MSVDPVYENFATTGADLRLPIVGLSDATIEAGLAAVVGGVIVDVSVYGATGDGLTDDTAAINRAIEFASANGGGEVTFGVGTFIHTGLTIPSNIRLRGKGAGTTLYLASGGNTHCLSLTNVSDVEISDLIINGNRTGQTTLGHGIRLQGTTRVRVRNMNIIDAPNYGIGVIGTGGVTSLYIDDVYISGSGSDGIDIKNQDDINEDIRISNLTITGFDANLVGAKAGIDVRGPVRLTNIQVFDTNALEQSTCIRFREGEPVAAANGEGGFRSVLANYRCVTSLSDSTAFGLGINADRISISNGFIKGNANSYGVSMGGSKNILTGLQIDTADTGIRFSYADADIDASDNRISNFIVSNATFGVDVRDDCDRNGFFHGAFYDCTTGIRILSGADDTYLSAGMMFVDCGSNIADSSATTRIGGNGTGVVVEANVESEPLAADTSGTETFSVAHGLTFTPTNKDVSLTIIQETGVSDYRSELLKVDGCTSTLINGRVVFNIGSSTPGATARVGIRVRVKA